MYDSFNDTGINPDYGRLENSEYYFHTDHASILIINWIQNRPEGSGWVKITKRCYDILTREIN